jgi:hypothetical protein
MGIVRPEEVPVQTQLEVWVRLRRLLVPSVVTSEEVPKLPWVVVSWHVGSGLDEQVEALRIAKDCRTE